MKSLFFNRFTHWNTSKIMYLSLLYPQEPSVNDPGQNLDRPFFRHFWQFFRSKWQSMNLLFDMVVSYTWGLGLKIMFYDVFWCPGALGTFLKWFWINFISLIFSWFFSKKLGSMTQRWHTLSPSKNEYICAFLLSF